MNELALFAGAGGGILASKLLRTKVVCAVEINEYCRRVLVRRQNTGELTDRFPIWDDIYTFNGHPWRGSVNLVSGGFPCQSFSTAAHGNNTAVDLWPEMRRVVSEVLPELVFAENVSASASNKAGDDLEQMGYKTKALSLSAKDLGADHNRRRYWLLAYTNNASQLLCKVNAEAQISTELYSSIWKSYPGKSRIPDGLAYRMDRLKATGNGQVPIVAATAFSLLSKEILNQDLFS